LTSYIRSLKVKMDTFFSKLPQGLRDYAEGSVLSDLLKDVPCLMSEELKAILKFFLDL